ncbi:regulating synaptic membrane exocytosis protein 1 isoform X2 [Anthonomus grandis grandis]|uniref:regulating synaptic membrane exocytosis protein 1 isoform X2 n=1 Tax=Anthonomus grandis grandis TaxID=2921223 RepID=UPI00216559E1|nr:regulating synaptic membrane exocytosis protein 1 isoform X2 [Anthonomus grandis grandis]
MSWSNFTSCCEFPLNIYNMASTFQRRMVAAEPGPQNANSEAPEGGTTFGKLRQTLSSSLLTAQDKVNKMGPRPSLIPDLPPVEQQQHQSPPTEEKPLAPPKTEPGKPPSRAGACRVCLKAFKPDDFSRTCATCTQRVCEDCASYSKLSESEDPANWTCSVCRRKMQSRATVISQDSNESLLEIPLQELQRRHSEARLGSSSGGLNVGGLGSGLAPPRSPELRRHSDVSPASLKELEKLKGGGGSKTPDPDWTRGGGRSRAGSRANSPPRGVTSDVLPQIPRSRRASRVARQHSYDDEVKATLVPGPGGEGGGGGEGGLGLPAPMPRRASAYDVFSVPALSTVTPNSSGRRASFRVAPPEPSSPPSPETAPQGALAAPEDDRRNRRRGSHLPDIGGLRTIAPPRPTPALEDLEAAPRRQASVDAEAIRIVIHDVDSAGGASAAQKRVVLRRDPGDKAHRTRGFGMRVVGGKTSTDGHLFAYVVWTVPGGPAEKGGLQQGDKVLEWGGVSLIDRNFEEVCAIMDHHTGDTVELLVEHATDLRMCDFLDEPPLPPPSSGVGGRKTSEANVTALHVDTENDKGPSSPTRRKLPKTPEQLAKERIVSGRIQIQVWYHDERKELVVAVLAGDDLAPRDDTLGFGCLPEAYARLCLLPLTTEEHCQQTDVAPVSQNPIWNANLSFLNVPGDELMERVLEITLWDLIPHNEHAFLGECSVDLQKAFLDDRAVWCRLEDPRQLRGRSPHTSPRGSIAGAGKRGTFGDQRSVSDDVDSIGECASLLHPDHAWGSRRGSSQSEQLEVEVYQLGKDFSRSLPGSRRSSFQSAQEQAEAEQVAVPPPASYSRDRRRSSCTRMLRDPEEILKSLKAVKGELGRTMSLTADKRRRSSTAVPATQRKRSVMEIVELPCASPPSSPERSSPPHLGPGQIKPRGFKLSGTKPVEIKLGLLMTKGQLEVEVVCARHIPNKISPPDTYVKCYLREGERWLQKKKTRVSRHSCEPQFRQTLKYQACDVLGRSLVVMLWERQSGFEHNQGLGGAEISLDSLTLTHLVVGWYPLFPINSLGSDSNDSP